MKISEKYKAAQAIAEALGSYSMIKQPGFSIFHVKSRDIYVIPLRGHILQHDTHPKYKSWNAQDPRNIITDKTSIQKKPNSYAKPYIQALKAYSKKCNHCIIATDADIEGCNIGLIDALSNILPVNRSIQVSQLWLNTLQKQDILHAYANLIPPKYDWANSAEARAKIDATIGFSATREVSLTLKPVLHNLNAKFASIGRVQSSLLYLLYLREKEIREFKPDKYWIIQANLLPKTTSQPIILKVQHSKNPFKDENYAKSIYTKIQNAKSGNITKITNTPRKVTPPFPLNTSKALMLLTKQLGISANTALKTLEELYLNKLISYPRTDSNKYTSSFDHIQYLRNMVTNTVYGGWVQNLFQNNRVHPRNGPIDAGDHPPITPIESVDPNSSKFKTSLQEKVYNIIARHYLALFGEDAEEVQTKIDVDISSELFYGRFLVLIKPGFFEIAPFLKPNYDIDVKLNQGVIPVKEILLEEKQTQPPPRYTDTSILKLMERNNLGTKSTRPTHIETLEKRKYIQRMQKTYFIMELGYILMDSLKTIWMSFLEPKFTEWVETHLEAVKNGKISMQKAIDTVLDEFLKLFDKFRSQKTQFFTQMKSLEQSGNIVKGKKAFAQNSITSIKGSYSSNSINRTSLSTSFCPVCKKVKMQLIITMDRKKFLKCSDPTCKNWIPLPKNGSPRLLKGTCSICGFNIIKISGKKNNKKLQYYMCPICWHKGFGDKTLDTGYGFCSSCKEYHVIKGFCKKK